METLQPTLAWTRQFGSNNFDHAEDLTVDASGNVYLTGHSLGAIGKEDGWIAKVDSTGNLLWIHQLGSYQGREHVHGITTDSFGFIYVSGTTTGSLVSGHHQGGQDAWLIKYDPDGKHVWKRQLGTASRDAAHGIAVDNSGHIYVAGYTHGDLEGSSPVLEGSESSEADADAWLAKFDNAGNKLFLKHIGSRANDVAYDLAVDAFGNVYLGGYTRGRISTNSEDRGSKQIWVMKVDANGDQVWLREFGVSAKDDEVRAIATDNQGNVYVTGMTYLERTDDNQLKRNVFITKIRSSGSIHWSRFLGTEETDIAYGIATDPLNNIFVTGYTRGELVEGEAKGQGQEDVFVAKFDPAGEELWVHQLGTTADERGEAVAVDDFGNIFIAGYTAGRLDQGQNFGAKEDAFVSKFLGNPSAQDQFQLLADYLQKMNDRISRIEVHNTPNPHES